MFAKHKVRKIHHQQIRIKAWSSLELIITNSLLWDRDMVPRGWPNNPVIWNRVRQLKSIIYRNHSCSKTETEAYIDTTVSLQMMINSREHFMRKIRHKGSLYQVTKQMERESHFKTRTQSQYHSKVATIQKQLALAMTSNQWLDLLKSLTIIQKNALHEACRCLNFTIMVIILRSKQSKVNVSVRMAKQRKWRLLLIKS